MTLHTIRKQRGATAGVCARVEQGPVGCVPLRVGLPLRLTVPAAVPLIFPGLCLQGQVPLPRLSVSTQG